MSSTLRDITPTFEDIRSSVWSAVSTIRSTITRKICSHFNRIPLTLERVTKYCDDNCEVKLWNKSLPASVRGLTIFEQDTQTFIVVCNNKEKNPLVRLKIILHELGHYLLHQKLLREGTCHRATSEWFGDQIEKEANLFALMAMVPDDQVRKVCTEHLTFEDRVRYLAETFAFTQEEAVVRIAAYDTELRKSSYQEMWDRFVESCGT